MTRSIVEFEMFKQSAGDDEPADGAIEKDGMTLYVAGVVGPLRHEFDTLGYELFSEYELFDGVDVSKFWNDSGNTISQSICCVFDVRYVSSYCRDYDVDEWDVEIDYLGIADTSKWDVVPEPA